MRLTTYLNGTRIGWFEQRDGRAITLEYDPVWQRQAGRLELSLSLPKSRRKHVGTAPGNYLWNLLPDSEEVLARWGRAFGVSARNPLALRSRTSEGTSQGRFSCLRALSTTGQNSTAGAGMNP